MEGSSTGFEVESVHQENTSPCILAWFTLFRYPTLGELQWLLLQLVGDLGRDPKAIKISFPLRLHSARCHGLIHFCFDMFENLRFRVSKQFS